MLANLLYSRDRLWAQKIKLEGQFLRCHAISINSVYRIFHIDKKKKLHGSIHHAEFRKYAKFYKNPLETLKKYTDPENCQFLRTYVCQNRLYPP